MAQTLDIHIDASSRSLLAAGSARNGTLPSLVRNDNYDLRLRIRQSVGSGYEDLDLTGATIRVGIGNVDAPPTSGTWKLGLSGTTSGEIAYDATAFSVYNAISGIASTGVTVVTYGSGGSAWVITSATAGSAVTFSGDAFGLFPQSDVFVTTRKAPATGVTPEYLVQLAQEPFVYSDSFVAASTANVVTLVLIQEGSSSATTKNETYQLTVGNDVDGGSLAFSYGGVAGTAVGLSSRTTLASSLNDGIGAIAGLTGGISVEADSSQTRFTISFIDTLGAQNIATALVLDAGGVQYARFYTTTLTLGTAGLMEAFNVAGASSITPRLEVEIVESGKRRTVYQGQITIDSDLLTASGFSPTTYTLP